MDLNAIKSRLNKLQTTTKKSAETWKPEPGKHQIRLVPYKYCKENPFIELYFHYGINNKTYLSPISFGRPDPIVEFAEKLKRMGDKDDWKAANKMMPKLRTFVPVLVRGEEAEGVRFWGFGKTVYQEILSYIADPDYGDITDPTTGRDLAVEIVSAEDSGTNFQSTSIRVKPKESPLAATPELIEKYLTAQKEITETYQELTYAELKSVLEKWLNPDAEDETTTAPTEEASVSAKVLEIGGEKETVAAKKVVETPVVKKTESTSDAETVKKLSDVANAFDDLFGPK